MPESDLQQFVAWAKVHAISLATVESDQPTDDLQPLKELIGQARVVALGESDHDIHELLALRNRFFKFLVEEMDFTAIAAETGFSESIITDEYVLGANMDKAAAVKNVFQWSSNAYAENRDLVEWIRQHNANPATIRKVRFYGFDLTGGEKAKIVHSRRALDDALAYINQVDSDSFGRVQASIEPFLERFNERDYLALTPGERDNLTAAINDLINLFEAQSAKFLSMTSELAFHRAYRNAVAARQLDAHFRALPQAADDPQIDFGPAANARDLGMADNLRWALEREGPKGRIFVFSHNLHVMKPSRVFKDPYPEYFPGEPCISMGMHLNSTLKNELVVFGSTFNQMQGEPGFSSTEAESIGGVLSLIGKALYVLDLHTASDEGSAARWLNHGRRMRVNSGDRPPENRYAELNPAEAFDALIFIELVRNAYVI